MKCKHVLSAPATGQSHTLPERQNQAGGSTHSPGVKVQPLGSGHPVSHPAHAADTVEGPHIAWLLGTAISFFNKWDKKKNNDTHLM